MESPIYEWKTIPVSWFYSDSINMMLIECFYDII